MSGRFAVSAAKTVEIVARIGDATRDGSGRNNYWQPVSRCRCYVRLLLIRSGAPGKHKHAAIGLLDKRAGSTPD
jgi:hypothetical protein